MTDGMKFANQLTLQEGDYPGLSGWAQCNHKGPCKRVAGDDKSGARCGDVSKRLECYKGGAVTLRIRQPLEAEKSKI